MSGACVELTREMLENPIDVQVDGAIDFDEAKRRADTRARRKDPDPMLLAWYDRKAGSFSPRAECCREDKPSWLIYAENRGGDLVIDVNAEEYVFVYRSSNQ